MLRYVAEWVTLAYTNRIAAMDPLPLLSLDTGRWCPGLYLCTWTDTYLPTHTHTHTHTPWSHAKRSVVDIRMGVSL